MTSQPEEVAWTESEEPLRVRLDGKTDYTNFGDKQLLDERGAQQTQLDELVLHPGSSPAVLQLRASIEREIGYMSDELGRRGRSKDQSSGRTRSRLRLWR
jgi:hypothetical protein